MAKFIVLFLSFAFVVAFAQAASQRKRVSSRLVTRQRTRVLARQELDADAAVTPYPSADELKPEVPFNEIPDVAAEFPGDVEQQPDEVYGPPEQTDDHIPDEVYGPPEFWLPTEESDLTFEEHARLVAARRSAALRQKQRLAYRKAAAYRQAVKRSFVRPAKFITIGKRFA